jgi:rare lipoprotein A (peptidoglycan hydrolase)
MSSRRFRPVRLASLALAVAAASGLGACVSTDTTAQFSEEAYGVSASPRVTNRVRIPSGGGYEHVGAPYVVAGRTYVPQEDPDYSAIGMASWYGPNFHGRLTANGEIFDMYALTAAHPTLPLPSYVRVTNIRSGASLVVRVNDRGPFHDGRIIDLSARAAELLGVTATGVAQIQVDYIGRASLDGNDERMLLATYQEPDTRQTVQLAYNDATRRVTTDTGGFFSRFANDAAAVVYQPAALTGAQDPLAGLLAGAQTYAPLPRLTPAQQAAELAAAGALPMVPAGAPVVIQVGVFRLHENASQIAVALTDFGTVTVEQYAGAAGPIWSVQVVTIEAHRQATIDAATAAGAQGAYALAN